jgi:hypothetical protein
MAITVKEVESDRWDVYDDDRIVARIVPFERGSEWWKLVDLDNTALSTRRFETPQLAGKFYSPTRYAPLRVPLASVALR